MGKRIVTILLIAIISIGIIPNFSISAYAENKILKIGDYVEFGTYYDQPILWRVIHIDQDGDPLLYADRILTLKAFDAGGYYHKEENRIRWGSNYWQDSTIRQWLNSSEKSIKWIQNPPTKENMWYGENPYDQEKGFLADGNFTEKERNAIKPVAHKVLLTEIDKDKKDGGSEPHQYYTEIYRSIENYDQSYYKNVTDNVFLLSWKEIRTYVHDRYWEHGTTPTPEAIENSTYKIDNVTMAYETKGHWMQWLRTPVAEKSYGVRISSLYGQMAYHLASYGCGGVRPALYLKQSSVNFKSGSGDKDLPYKIDRGVTTQFNQL